ncbi:MAG: hypothetical protein HY341_01350 [Candidatus Kerfeldbacteria bacterium]|nr:hypothetical protein [Candidatus Kerfeldbacteria bacterium]
MPRITMYKVLLATLLLAGVAAVGTPATASAGSAVEEHRILTPLVPDTLQSVGIVQTQHVEIPAASSWWRVRQWQSIDLPDGWENSGYYVELWDHDNDRIPRYGARLITERVIDLSSLDASLYPRIRVILFQPTDVAPRSVEGQVAFTYTERFNARLAVLGSLVTFMALTLIAGAIRYRLGVRSLLRETGLVLHRTERHASLRSAVALSLLVVVWSWVFGTVLGSFAGGMQILYLWIKLPFLFLCAFLISAGSNGVLCLLLGVKADFQTMVIQSLSAIALTAVGLAALTPVLWYLIHADPEYHGLLLWVIGLFIASFAFSAIRSETFLRSRGTRQPLVALSTSTVLYGAVVLQLAWMLRPWVGVLDPIAGTLPFSRLYGGSAFVALAQTLTTIIQ